jgi:hypothetical protein
MASLGNDPTFEGGPNFKDPEVSGAVIRDVRIAGDPIYYPSFGDLWMPTWADDRLFLTWGDGTGFGDGYPVGYPAYESHESVTVTFCEEDEYLPEEEGYFPCWLWCNIFPCGAGYTHATAPLTDAGVLAFVGPVPNFVDVSIASIDVPSGEAFFLQNEPGGPMDVTGRNDKPSSLLFYDGRLYLAGHSPAGQPTLGYLAYSDDYGQTWTELPGSPWGETSNFRVLMFINMGQNYVLNQDGYVYALGVGTEASWTARTVYLARVPKDAIADYGAYEYFTGLDGDEPGWSPNEAEATPLDDLHTTGQASAMYHEGTGRYLFMTTDAGPPDHYGVLYEALQPWGPWREAGQLCFDFVCASEDSVWADGKYIAGLIPKDAGLNHVYFTIAGGDQHYQLQIGMLEWETDPYPWKVSLPLVLKQE